MPEADQDRTGEGRQVDNRRRLEVLLHVGDRVGQHEPPFGIGVDHFDGLAGHGRDDVAGTLGIAARHVLDEPANADDVRLGLAKGERLHRSRHGPSAAHVPFHCFHARGGLDRDAAGIEGYALADECGRLSLAAAVPFENEKPASRDEPWATPRSAPIPSFSMAAGRALRLRCRFRRSRPAPVRRSFPGR